MRRLLLLLLIAGCAEKKPTPPPKGEPKADPPKFQHQTGLRFDVPGSWKAETPGNNMRKAQYAVPDKEKQAGDAEFVLFYFGTMGGGSVEDNIDRWIGQMKGSTRESAKIEKLKSEFEITLVDLSGTYVGQKPNSEERFNEPDYRMLAAAVETPKGLHFFKFVGPQETVGDWVDEFKTIVKGARLP